MGVSNPGRTYGGYSGGFNWSHEARVAGQIARATPEQRQQWQDYVAQMRAEQVAEPDDKVPGLDEEIDTALEARKIEQTSWLPFVVGKSYRLLNGLNATCKEVKCCPTTGRQTEIHLTFLNQRKFVDFTAGPSGRAINCCGYDVIGDGYDVVGPWNESLRGKTPPAGFQWTGEFREVLPGEFFTPVYGGAWKWDTFIKATHVSTEPHYILVKV